jgi:hypothetical protein
MSRPRQLLTVLFGVLVAAACQPVGEPELPSDDGEAAGATAPVGAPASSLPDDVDGLLAELEGTARQWQSGARATEVVIGLDEAGEWSSAAVTYLAPDADRFLRLRVDHSGTSQDRPTLEGFDLHPLPGPALEEVPDLEGVLEPRTLIDAAAGVLGTCDVGAPDTVVYTSGAPAAWDGESWTEEPRWTALVSGAGGALVEPDSGEPAAADPCVAPAG